MINLIERLASLINILFKKLNESVAGKPQEENENNMNKQRFIYYNILPNFYLDEVLKYEGGYVNDPLDKGGETNMGITAKALETAKKQGLIPNSVTVKTLTKEHARIIYEHNYYLAGKCNIMPHPLSFAHFDACVNHGVGGAGKLLQKMLNGFGYGLTVDGIIGTKTIKALEDAINSVPILDLVVKYCSERQDYYYNIVKNNPSQQKFLKGWLNRLDNVRKFCGIR